MGHRRKRSTSDDEDEQVLDISDYLNPADEGYISEGTENKEEILQNPYSIDIKITKS